MYTSPNGITFTSIDDPSKVKIVISPAVTGKGN